MKPKHFYRTLIKVIYIYLYNVPMHCEAVLILLLQLCQTIKKKWFNKKRYLQTAKNTIEITSSIRKRHTHIHLLVGVSKVIRSLLYMYSSFSVTVTVIGNRPVFSLFILHHRCIFGIFNDTLGIKCIIKNKQKKQ